MIIYDLSCENSHTFEGWFRSAEDFDDQIQRELVRCPQCDHARVRRIPSAVAIGGNKPDGAMTSSSSGSSAGNSATALMPSSVELKTMYRQLVNAIVQGSEDVGSAFAEEARRIHYNEAPERAIRGQATADECEALRDEGIEVLHLPVTKDEGIN